MEFRINEYWEMFISVFKGKTTQATRFKNNFQYYSLVKITPCLH